MTYDRFIVHVGDRRVAKHLGNIQVKRFHTISLTETEMGITSRFTYYIQRSTFAFSDFSNMFTVLFIDEQTHSFLAFVGNNLFAGQGLVSDRQSGHVNFSTTFFYQL